MIAMHKDINEVEITIFDTETTGLDPGSGDRIVEIAAIRIRGQERLGTFASLINSGREISPAALAVNKISQAMLRDAPLSRLVIPEFLKFSEGSCLCAYNAGFDWEFLNSELGLIGLPPARESPVLDILKMARRIIPGLERYALWFVADKFGIRTEQEHRALSDVEMAYSVFLKLKETIIAKGVRDFDNFLHLFGINPHLLADLNMHKQVEIQEAIDLKMNLKIKYLSTSGAKVSEREITPKELKHDHQHSYLVAHCLLRNEERTFRIDGILHLQVL